VSIFEKFEISRFALKTTTFCDIYKLSEISTERGAVGFRSSGGCGLCSWRVGKSERLTVEAAVKVPIETIVVVEKSSTAINDGQF
jgi:hypothetical protein